MNHAPGPIPAGSQAGEKEDSLDRRGDEASRV